MYSGGASKSPKEEKKENVQDNMAEVRIVFVSQTMHLSYSFSLIIGWSNNMAEYEAVITELQIALQISIANLRISVTPS